VAGMYAEDAQAFCRWLTQQYSGNTMIFRLPTLEEASLSPASDGVRISCYVQGNEFQLAKLPVATQQEFARQLSSIVGVTPLPLPLNLFALSTCARDHARARIFSFARGKKVRDLSLVLDDVHNLVNRFVYSFGQGFDLTTERARARYYDLNLNEDYVLAYDFARNLSRDIDFTRRLALVRDLAPTGENEVARDLAFAFARARDLAPNNDFDFVIDSLVKAIQANNLPIAVKLLSSIKADSDDYTPQKHLSALLAVASAETLLAAQLAYRRYVIYVFEYIYVQCEKFKELPQGRQMLKRRFDASDSISHLQQATLELYWWLQIVQAREEGKLPAWEGIRIVREQVPPVGPSK